MPIFASQRSVTGVFSARFKRPGLLPFRLRQVITTGYTSGGYRGGVAWRNVNSYAFATDTPTNRGDILNEAGAYCGGAMNRTSAYTFSVNGTGTEGMGNFNKTAKFNMRTFTNQGATAVAPATFADIEALIQYDLQGTGWIAYVNGGNSINNVLRFNMSTDAWSTGPSSGLDQAGVGSGHHFHENEGIWWADSTLNNASNGQRRFVYATETETNPNVSFSGANPASQQKGLISKEGRGWQGNEGGYNAGFSYRQWDYLTNTITTLGANTKAILNSGEENHTQSQDRGYVLGHYNGDQVNESGYYTFSNGARLLLPTSSWPTGTQSGTGSSVGSAIVGRSSGAGFWSD